MIEAKKFTFSNNKRKFEASIQAMVLLIRRFRTNPHIRKTALGIIRDVPERDHRAEAATLHAFVRDRIPFRRDIHGVETISTPDVTLMYGGDCDDKALLLAVLLESVGFITRLIVVTNNFLKNFSHILPEVNIEGTWYPMETIRPLPFGKMAKFRHVRRYAYHKAA